MPLFFLPVLPALVLGLGQRLSDEDNSEPVLYSRDVVTALASSLFVVSVLGALLSSEPVPDVVSVGDGVTDALGEGESDGVVLGEVAGEDAGGGLSCLVGGEVLQFVPLDGLLDGPDEGTWDELPTAGVPRPDGLPLLGPEFVPVGDPWLEAGAKSAAPPPIAA